LRRTERVVVSSVSASMDASSEQQRADTYVVSLQRK